VWTWDRAGQEMLRFLKSVGFVKAAIIASWLIPFAAVVEIFVTHTMVYSPLTGCAIILYIWSLKDPAGKPIFTTNRMERFGFVYYFPLRLADRLRQ
jgi:hypothetical protein